MRDLVVRVQSERLQKLVDRLLVLAHTDMGEAEDGIVGNIERIHLHRSFHLRERVIQPPLRYQASRGVHVVHGGETWI